MSTTFQSPNNPLAAMWASAVEFYVRKENPGLSVQQVRRLPMMQGLYEHLSQFKRKIPVPMPPADTELSGEALRIARNAWLSQEFFNLAVTTTVLDSIGEDSSMSAKAYNWYIGLLTKANDYLDIPSFSTEDYGGFFLCVLVYVGMVGLNNTGPLKRKCLHYLESQLNIPLQAQIYINDFMLLMAGYDFTIQYRDAHDYPDYTTIPWQIPAGAQVVMLGDWGTGLDDADQFLYNIWKQAYNNNEGAEIVFIHLGDIYYCGLPYECQNYFYDVFQSVGVKLLSDLGNPASFNPNPPIFALPGNHEYYSLGYGYFEMLDKLNANVSNISHSDLYQQCSFFCLQTADQNWQFLGMDTGQADGNGVLSALQAVGGWVLSKLDNFVDKLPDWMGFSADMVTKLYEDMVGPFQPKLQPNEVSWLKDKLDDFPGKTILLSHHQVFSREAMINHASPEYLNTWLDKTFNEYYKGDVAAWYWGHEHTFAVYLDGLMGLNKGRLIGSSSYEATEDDDTPYADNYPAVLFDSDVMDPTPINVGDNGLYYHAGAILIPSNTDMDVFYYQYPAWSQLDSGPSPEVGLEYINRETINTAFKSLKPRWQGNVPINQDIITTDYAPSLTTWNDQLYMLYPDGTDNSTTLTLCTANAADLSSDYDNIATFWSDKQPITVNGSNVQSGASPVVVAVDDVLYGFYLDDDNYIVCMTCPTTGDITAWTAIEKLSTSVSAISGCYFQGCIYVVYLETGSSKLRLMYYNIGTDKWKAPGKITGTDGNDIESTIAPALSADATHLYMIYKQESNTDIRWAVGTPSVDAAGRTYDITWSDQGDMEITINNGNTNPDTSIGMTMCYASDVFFMVYASTNNDLVLTALNGADKDDVGSWVGKNDIKPTDPDTKKASTAQTSQCPAMVVTSGGGFLVYRDNGHDEIYWAYY